MTSLGRLLMYSRKRVGSRMDPYGTPALIRFSCKNIPSRTPRIYLLLRTNKIQPDTRAEMPYVKYHSLISPKNINSPSNSFRYNCHKIWSWLGRAGAILKIRKEATFLKLIIYKFFKYFTIHRKENSAEQGNSFQPYIFLHHFYIHWPQMRPFTNLGNKIPSDRYCRVKLVCMKDQALSSSETTLE